MNVIFTKQFGKGVLKIADKKLVSRIEEVIFEVKKPGRSLKSITLKNFPGIRIFIILG